MNSAKQRWRPVLSFFVNNICFTHFSAVLDMVTDIWENATWDQSFAISNFKDFPMTSCSIDNGFIRKIFRKRNNENEKNEGSVVFWR